MKKLLVGGVLTLLVGVGLFVFVLDDRATAPESTAPATSPRTNDAEQTEGFSKEQFSLTDPTSPWIIVNKKRSLPAGYVPEDLRVPDVHLRLAPSEEQMKFRRVAETDLKAMFLAAKAESVDLVFGSGYRSEATQKQFYNQYVVQSGQANADTFSARPGHSEHQTGLAFDLTTPDGSCHLQICFESTPGGQWVQKHAHEYGFVVRYPNGKESITGYQYEPWHLRYVGLDLARELLTKKQTLEEFFELGPADQY